MTNHDNMKTTKEIVSLARGSGESQYHRWQLVHMLMSSLCQINIDTDSVFPSKPTALSPSFVQFSVLWLQIYSLQYNTCK